MRTTRNRGRIACIPLPPGKGNAAICIPPDISTNLPMMNLFNCSIHVNNILRILSTVALLKAVSISILRRI